MKEEKKEIRFLWQDTPGWASLALGVVSFGLTWAKVSDWPWLALPLAFLSGGYYVLWIQKKGQAE